MKALDSRQKKLLALALAAVVLVAVLLVAPLFAPRREEDVASRVAVIPEADLTERDGSKVAHYQSGQVEQHWDRLRDEAKAPELPPSEEEVAPRRAGRRPRQVDVDDIFGDYKNATPPGRQGEGAEASPKEPPSAPATGDSLPPPRPQVKRSGAVSSLDEDLSGDLGNGFSTLDGTDRWVGSEEGKPYRCMFTRDEKVRNGQRITLRLLEDLVIGHTHIPRNTHLQGLVTISDRMEVKVTSLDVGGRILSFHFEAFDTDGGKGIYCSDLSKTRKEVTDQGLATVSSTLSSRLGRIARDAATVGASIVRNKAGEATVTVPAGYTFYIIEEFN